MTTEQNNRKKILFVITKSNFGGAQRYVYDLATSLPQEKFDVAVAFGEGGVLEEKLNLAKIRTIKISSLHRDVSLFKDLSVFFELIKIFKKERPEIVHLNSTKVGALGAIAGKVCGIQKIIFTAHGWAFNEKRSAISKILITFLQWLTIFLCDVTIAVSKNTAKDISGFIFIKKNKIKIIYNGITEPQYLTHEDARNSLNKTEKTFWIGTISELHKNKGLDIALEAFAKITEKFPQVIFAIIGAGEEKENLISKASQLDISDKVFFLGFIDNANKYLKAFDIFTLTSRTEALPYVILEAGLAKVPVIANDVGGISEIIDSPESGILIKKGPEIICAISEAMENLIGNPEQMQKIANNLQQKILTDFSKEKMLNSTFELYK